MTNEQAFSILLSTMMEAMRNKRYGHDFSDFERDWAPRLVCMMHQLQEKTFRVDHNTAFLTPVPKWREIFATSADGRLADHLLCDSLRPYIEKELHPRTFNNRIGMGCQAAINQVIEDIYEVSGGFTKPCRILKWDLKGFFPNALCDIIERCFIQIIDKYEADIIQRFGIIMPAFLKWLAMICVHCYPAMHCELRSPKYLWDLHIEPYKSLRNKEPGTGAPIGRLISQTGLGLYINDIVRWFNDECGINTTVFMDDGTMVVPEELHGYALSLIPVLRVKLAERGLQLNERKFYDQPYQHGLELLGSHIKPNRIHLNNCTYERAIDRVNELNSVPDKFVYIDKLMSSVNSYTGLMKNRNDYGRIMQLHDMIDDEYWRYLDWDQPRRCIVYRPKYSVRARLNKKYNLRLRRKESKHETARNSATHQRVTV